MSYNNNKSSNNNWHKFAIIVCFILLYIFYCISKLPNTERAYLYDPNTDNLYFVELVRQINKNDKFSFLNPFESKKLQYPDHCEYVGKLKENLYKVKVRREDFDNWLKELRKERQDYTQKTNRYNASGHFNHISNTNNIIIDYLYINLIYPDYLLAEPKGHLEKLREYLPIELLEAFTSDKSYYNPEQLATDAELVTKIQGIKDIVFVDAIVSKRYFGLKKPANKPADIKIIQPAILFRGSAYYIVAGNI